MTPECLLQIGGWGGVKTKSSSELAEPVFSHFSDRCQEVIE